MKEWSLEEIDAAIYALIAHRAELRAKQRELRAIRDQLAACDQVTARLEGWPDDDLRALQQLIKQQSIPRPSEPGTPSQKPWREWIKTIFKQGGANHGTIE